ncbi:uncharacterized protein N7446_007892 [Penicillium canescens]|uniref:Major facilitator superfamily (MFS) profile domain-containing protein n=1 Tax=Penicillium canescens TaxID=5083 RepID=A0AAD6IMD1_PENCN|nr:uncharacterized protein N7446_007892 [Penicillium canescens]KAJ6033816.1 hypothetical protein N7444_011587 [Penicillium canescens]KAJ6056993.1 hypothetical protein N7460_000267 [Penicillium canescens]KAJ6058309.1 hypothetical protein N7446_007892 [Penicillium canescens]
MASETTTTQADLHPLELIIFDRLDRLEYEQSPSSRRLSLQQAMVILQVLAVTLTASVVNGLVIVGLPTITRDLQLRPSLAFWPSSASSLATASTLLLAGSMADAVGPRCIELVGAFLSGSLIIGQGLCQYGEQFVLMRAFQGLGLALHLASSISIITQLMPQGKDRNLVFSAMGISQPLGFSIGLFVGGILVDTIGWRSGWYIAGGTTLFFAVIGLLALPKNKDHQYADPINNIRTNIDWVGACLASAFMALLCYFLAILSANPSSITSTESIVILCLAAIALPSFLLWMEYQVKRNRPALIPNSFWINVSFSSICTTIALSNAVLNSMELFTGLFFQEVQHLSAFQTSLRILPSLVVGVLVNLLVGFSVHKAPAVWIATITSFLCAGSPLLMAVIQPSWPYWANAFVAQLLQPISVDALFTIGLIFITDAFPDNTQALAGAVFNTSAQFGTALGLAVMQVTSTITTNKSQKLETQALMEGYRASFWTMFGFMLLCTVVSFLGLRNAGKVGLKRD